MDRIERSEHAPDVFPAIVTRKWKETILLLLSPQSERNKQRDGECDVMHRVCAITMLITNVEGRSFILRFGRHLSQMPEFVVVGGEDVNRKWLYKRYLKWVHRTTVLHALCQ